MKQTKTGTSRGFLSSNNPPEKHPPEMHAATSLLVVPPVLQLCHEEDRLNNRRDGEVVVHAPTVYRVTEAPVEVTIKGERRSGAT